MVVVLAACRSSGPGGATCGALSFPNGPGTSVPEIHGVASFGDTWLLVPGGYPVAHGEPFPVALRLAAEVGGGDISMRVVPKEFGPVGTVAGIVRATTPAWSRPGTEWQATVTIPESGCYLLGFVAGGVQGSFTLRVK